MIERLREKARQALATARLDLANGDSDAAANRCYYAALYAAWAAFAHSGLAQPRTHSGLIGELSKRFVKDGPLDRRLGATLGKLANLRAYADYTLDPTPRDKIESALNEAEAFVTAIEELIGRTT